ncbi:PLP-dependent aminotransferase family protein [Chitinophaga sedimenti]|uniref:aminotransferase-like domain-containing protein n=1 Tax=Chitinophaga sedimenti TaxID=2033606 RepID=UPI002005006F|nr:PLP-dependent aminotransferase family protein [Chitinophaga sedimenti]MCK7556016.1 PLP-dependent aminotransferase family protein [Chitinophaga sedimenti]
MGVQLLPYSNLIEINRQSAVPVFKQVAEGIVLLIVNEKLKPGYQLPASRDMASLLKINRTTVVSAYEELQVEGWIEVIERKGNFVAQQLPVVRPKPFEAPAVKRPGGEEYNSFYKKVASWRVSKRTLSAHQLMMNDGYPDVRLAPLDSIYDRYRFLSKRVYLHGRLLNDSAAGSMALRTELSHFLAKTRALHLDPSHVLVTHGAQLAIFIAASLILRPGSTVVVGDLNYILADRLFEQMGAKLIKVKVDENGIDVDEIERLCKKSPPDLLYIIPHHHHPTTVTLSKERRIKLLDIIRTYRLPVIEDDYDYDFHYENAPILPLASADHGGYVIYIGSISKTLAPTVRLGYLVAGDDFIRQASMFKQMVEIRGDVLFEEAVAHFFNTGEMQRHLRRSVKLYKERRDIFCDMLNSSVGDLIHFNTPAGGMAVWATFPPAYSIPDLASRLAEKGIFMNEGSLYRYNENVNGIRLGFASLNTAEMQKFIGALKECR